MTDTIDSNRNPTEKLWLNTAVDSAQNENYKLLVIYFLSYSFHQSFIA